MFVENRFMLSKARGRCPCIQLHVERDQLGHRQGDGEGGGGSMSFEKKKQSIQTIDLQKVKKAGNAQTLAGIPR